MKPKIGDEIYVKSSFSISNGSEDVVGGLATVDDVTESISGGEPCTFVSVKEHPGHSYNWDQFLEGMQDELKQRFGQSRAYPDPDIDTPWISSGDYVGTDSDLPHDDEGKYIGEDIW